MQNQGVEKHRARIARELGVEPAELKNHPYELEVGANGLLVLRWCDQAPDGILRTGVRGSYITHIRPGNGSARQDVAEHAAKKSRSA